jgi:hypothetical protein
MCSGQIFKVDKQTVDDFLQEIITTSLNVICVSDSIVRLYTCHIA